jgi:hypothetical protein
LDKALFPLFSISQFVAELDMFHSLPSLIGPPGQPGSLPLLPPSPDDPDGISTHRDMTSGVCADPDLVERFNKIAATIKENANMEGVLVVLELAPQAVLCLIYPLVNTEDFPPGVQLNSTSAIGFDLLATPSRTYISKLTLSGEDVIMSGPLTLTECSGDGTCVPAVEKAFIARYPITVPGTQTSMDDTVYQDKWGTAIALINWQALVDRSGVYETFEERGMEFQLTRTDIIVDPDSNEESEKVRKCVDCFWGTITMSTSARSGPATLEPLESHHYDRRLNFCRKCDEPKCLPGPCYAFLGPALCFYTRLLPIFPGCESHHRPFFLIRIVRLSSWQLRQALITQSTGQWQQSWTLRTINGSCPLRIP